MLEVLIHRYLMFQSVEYFAEWCIYPANEAFQRIQAGITEATLIGDKARWFAPTLTMVTHTVWTNEFTKWLTYAMSSTGLIATDGLRSLRLNSVAYSKLNENLLYRKNLSPHFPVLKHANDGLTPGSNLRICYFLIYQVTHVYLSPVVRIQSWQISQSPCIIHRVQWKS